MKPSFSFGDALNAPVVLIRRRPLSVFAWGLMMIAVVTAIYALVIPLLAGLPWGDGEAAMEAYAGQMGQVSAASNGLTIVMYLVILVVFNAAGRATLNPATRDRFLFMRLGMDEVRVAVVVVAAFVGWYVALLLLVLIGVALGAALWSVGEAAAVGTVLVYGLLVCALAVVGWARLSLMGAATLVLGRFAFAEGWAIARGQLLKLIGLNLVIWLIYMLSYIVLAVLVGGILVGAFFAQGLSWPQTIEQPQDLMPVIRPMILPLVATLPIFAFSYGVWIVFLAAPFVRAARQLLDGAPAARPEAGRIIDDRLQTP